MKNGVAGIAVACLLGGCGTVVPPISYEYDTPYSNAVYVNGVAGHVSCELQNAVYEIYQAGEPDWLREWAAKITLTLTVDEKSNFNPGLRLASTPGTLGLGLGGKVGATASRVQEMTWFVAFADFFPKTKRHVKASQLPGQRDCYKVGGLALSGDLRIAETMRSVNYVAPLDTISHPFVTGGPYDDVVHHVTFEINLEGNLDPTFKFVNVSSDASGGLLGAVRDRKDDLLITMGPTQLKVDGRTLIAGAGASNLETVHNINRIGQSVSSTLPRPR